MITKRISKEYKTKINFDFFEISISDKLLEDTDTLDSFLFDCQCLLLLIDITDKESFEQIKKLKESIDFSEYSYLKIIFVENKIDDEKHREIDEEEINAFMKENNIEDKMQISIKEGTNIDELIEKMDLFTRNEENDIPINYIAQDSNEKTNQNIVLDKNITLILIGDTNVGKTCFFTRFNKNHFQETFLSTIGMDKYIKYYKYKDEECKIILWDTAGQDRFKSLPKKYYQNADGIFLFFDVTNKETFNDVAVWMNEINNNTTFEEEGQKVINNGNKIIVYLIGNKIDILNRCISKEEAEEKATFYGIKYYEMSCKLNMNVAEISSRMVNDCILKYEERKEEKIEMSSSESFRLKQVKKEKTNQNKHLNCCGKEFGSN